MLLALGRSLFDKGPSLFDKDRSLFDKARFINGNVLVFDVTDLSVFALVRSSK
jgi:hypothetical protein